MRAFVAYCISHYSRSLSAHNSDDLKNINFLFKLELIHTDCYSTECSRTSNAITTREYPDVNKAIQNGLKTWPILSNRFYEIHLWYQKHLRLLPIVFNMLRYTSCTQGKQPAKVLNLTGTIEFLVFECYIRVFQSFSIFIGGAQSTFK